MPSPKRHKGRDLIERKEAAELLGVHKSYIKRGIVDKGLVTDLTGSGVSSLYRDEVEALARSRNGTADASADENSGANAQTRKRLADHKRFRATLVKAANNHNEKAAGLVIAYDAARSANSCAEAWADFINGAEPGFLKNIAEAGRKLFERDIEAAVEDATTQLRNSFAADLEAPAPDIRALLDHVDSASLAGDLQADIQARTSNTKADSILLEDGVARGVFVDEGETRRKIQGIGATARNQVMNIRHRIQAYVPVAQRADIGLDLFKMLNSAADSVADLAGGAQDTADVAGTLAEALRPLEPMTGSEWQNKNRRLGSDVTARPGPMLIELTPYLRMPLDIACGSDPNVRQVTFASGAQLSKSETLLLSTVGYYVDRSPAGIVAAYPTESLARTFASTRFPALLETPSLAAKVDEVKEDKTRKGRAEAMTSRSFSGGNLAIVSAGSVSELSGRPAKLLIFDEIDRAAQTKEGDPFELLLARSITFPDRMAIAASTPTHIETSRVWKLYLEGSQAQYFVPCDCGFSHVMSFDNLDASDPEKPDSAYYACPDCGEAWDDAQRLKAIEHGEWREARPDIKTHKSFQLSSLNSPFMTNSELFKKKLNAERGDLETKITFRNLYEGLPWDDSDEASNPEKMAQRLQEDALLQDFGLDSIPPECLLLTAGVDVQIDRIEVVITGWGEPNRADGDGTTCWALGHVVLHGDPSADAVWDDLDDLLQTKFKHPFGGEIGIDRAAIDTGYSTQNALAFAARRPARYFAIKGSNQFTAPIWAQSKSKPKRGEAKLHIVGVSQMKIALFRSMLPTPRGSEGHVAFADMEHYSPLGIEGFADQLTSEYLFTNFTSKGPVQEWKRRGRTDREVLDCMIYASAARRSKAHIDWKALERRVTRDDTPAAPPPVLGGDLDGGPRPARQSGNTSGGGGWASFDG